MKKRLFTLLLASCLMGESNISWAAKSFLPVREDSATTSNARWINDHCKQRSLSQEDQHLLLRLTESAEQENINAQYRMGEIYYKAKNYEKALYWLEKADQGGHPLTYITLEMARFEFGFCPN